MRHKYVLEISVETAEAALAAESGGTDRIELCGDLSVGGITPSAEVMRAVRGQLRIPIFAMIRPRPGDFVYSAAEFDAIKNDIGSAKKFGLNGVVLGIMDSDHHVDVHRTRELVELARPLLTTFHRAFDECGDLLQALEDVMQTGAKRILTSGGAKSSQEGAAVISDLIEAAGERIVIVPGAGITARNIEEVARRTRAREFHSGLSAALPYGSKNCKEFEMEVRKLAKQIGRIIPAP